MNQTFETQTHLRDPMAIAANEYVGRNVRMRIGRESYIGVIEAADDQIITLISGGDPVAITLRTEAIDGIMAFLNPKAEPCSEQ